MSIFGPINVYAQLNLPESVRLAIIKLAVQQERTASATERQALALEAIVQKMNEPEPGGTVLTPEQEAILTTLVGLQAAKTEALRVALAVPPTE